MPALERAVSAAGSASAASVIVTRPAPEAQHWVAQLQQRGICAEALPLIEIASAIDLTAARDAWARLEKYAAVMFVSGNAVAHFFAAHRYGAGPNTQEWASFKSVRFMAPGPGTALALVAQGVPAAQVDTPPADAAQFDSEALWQVIGQRAWAGQRVLILRGQSVAPDASSGSLADAPAPGREWLARQLEQAGAAVDFVVVYERRAPRFTVLQRQRMAASQRDRSVWLFSSSEALAHLPPGSDWSQARAIATHSRIAQAARAAGWGVVIESRPALADIAASIESITL
jgi:uroporphyrinogen-III synthase